MNVRLVFHLPDSLPENLQNRWSFRSLRQVDELVSEVLFALQGLILGIPWRHRMEPEVVSAVVDCVRGGGRLLLLGFEFGDSHHNGNLGDLARHFGIYPETNIVGPPVYGDFKPYDVPVDFQVAVGDRHPLTHDLTQIRLANVQTLRVEPGGAEWLRVGDNVVYRPARGSVEYRGGILAQPGGPRFEQNQQAGWLPVAAEAPPGLCEDGMVHAIGTWDLPGRHRAFHSDDNLMLLERLLEWLSGAPVPSLI